jgi:hypothetical protein
MTRFITLTGVLLALSLPLSATTLNLEDFLETSLHNHPQINKTEADYFSAVKQNMANEAIQDWNLFANASRVYGASLFGAYEEDSRYTSTEAGVNKVFTQTGSRFGATLSREATVNQPGFGSFEIDDNYMYEVELSITQPLLKNALGTLDRHPLILKEHNDTLAEIVYKENLETFVSSLVAQYINWEASFRDLVILEAQAEKLRKQVVLITKQLRRGAAEQLDVVLAKQSLVSKENAVLAQKSRFENETRRIKNTMNGDVVRDDETLIPSEVTLVETELDLEAAVEYVRNESLISELAFTNESISEQYVSFYKAQTAPQLDLFASKAYQSSQTSDSSARKQIGENDPLTVGLVFTKSFENTAAKSAKSSAEFSLEAAKETTRLTLLTAEESVDITYSELEFLDRQIKKMKELLTLSEEAERLELKKYRQGRSNSFQFVLSAQERTLSTELQLEGLKRAKRHVVNRLNTVLDLYVSNYNLGDNHE